jgi:hypothetical protein
MNNFTRATANIRRKMTVSKKAKNSLPEGSPQEEAIDALQTKMKKPTKKG